MEGMVAVRPDGTGRMRLGAKEVADGMPPAGWTWDLTDPATQGCALAQLRERGEVMVTLDRRGVRIVVLVPSIKEGFLIRDPGRLPTYAEALAEALEVSRG